MIIHGDPELTAIVARLLVALAHPKAQASANLPDHARQLRYSAASSFRSEALRSAKAAALHLAIDVADAPDRPVFLALGYQHPTVAAMWRDATQGTDHADLCSSGLTEFALYLMAQEVA